PTCAPDGSAGRSSRSPHSHIHPTTRAGTPVTSAYAGTECVTTAPAPTNAYSPTSCPQTIVALAPIDAPRLTMVSRYSCLRDTWLRGFSTLVNTIEGPRNTSSWTLTFLPNVTLGMTTTFWPRLHSSPITAPAITWQKCQTRVPAPSVAPAST